MLLNDGETDGSFGGLAFSGHSEVYLCLDVETDLHFANLIQKWRRSGIGNFDFKMPDDEWATGDWEREDAATGGPLESLSDAKALVLLIGEYTRRQTPRVDLQLPAALQLDVPIIAVNLNDSRRQDHLCPRLIAKELALYIAFNPRILSFAIENWPRSHALHKARGEIGPFYYGDSIYRDVSMKS